MVNRPRDEPGAPRAVGRAALPRGQMRMDAEHRVPVDPEKDSGVKIRRRTAVLLGALCACGGPRKTCGCQQLKDPSPVFIVEKHVEAFIDMAER